MDFSQFCYGLGFLHGYFKAKKFAYHTVPLFPYDPRKMCPIDNGKLFTSWNNWVKENSEAKKVTLMVGEPNLAAGCFGNTLLKFSPQIIAVNLQIDQIDPDASMFACKHEFAHIKFNHAMIISGVLLIANIVMGILTSKKVYPCFLFATIIADKIWTRKSEVEADNFAIANATEKELCGGFRFFEAAIRSEKELYPTKGSQDMYQQMWENSWDFLTEIHPSPVARRNKIQTELEFKFGYDSINFSVLNEDPRIQKLSNYIISCQRKGKL